MPTFARKTLAHYQASGLAEKKKPVHPAVVAAESASKVAAAVAVALSGHPPAKPAAKPKAPVAAPAPAPAAAAAAKHKLRLSPGRLAVVEAQNKLKTPAQLEKEKARKALRAENAALLSRLIRQRRQGVKK